MSTEAFLAILLAGMCGYWISVMGYRAQVPTWLIMLTAGMVGYFIIPPIVMWVLQP